MEITVTLPRGITLTLRDDALRALRSVCQEPRWAGRLRPRDCPGDGL